MYVKHSILMIRYYEADLKIADYVLLDGQPLEDGYLDRIVQDTTRFWMEINNQNTIVTDDGKKAVNYML